MKPAIQPVPPLTTRRGFLSTSSIAAAMAGVAAVSTGGSTSAAAAPQLAAPAVERRLPRVAAINSEYRLRSHAYHIAGRFIYGYNRNGFHHQPPFELVRMWNHLKPPNDLAPRVCRDHGVELSDSLEQALGGASSLDVDAIDRCAPCLVGPWSLPARSPEWHQEADIAAPDMPTR